MPSQWREETGPHGAKRWVNLRTGHIQYRPPGSPHPAFVKAEHKRSEGQKEHKEDSFGKEYATAVPHHDTVTSMPKSKAKRQELTKHVQARFAEVKMEAAANLNLKKGEAVPQDASQQQLEGEVVHGMTSLITGQKGNWPNQTQMTDDEYAAHYKELVGKIDELRASYEASAHKDKPSKDVDALDVQHNEFMNVLNPQALVVEKPKEEHNTPQQEEKRSMGNGIESYKFTPLSIFSGSSNTLEYYKDAWNNRKGYRDAIFNVGRTDIDGVTHSMPYDSRMSRITESYLDPLDDDDPEKTLLISLAESGEAEEYTFRSIHGEFGGEGGQGHALTGSGHAKEVINKATGLFLAYLDRFSPDYVYYTAQGESRASLYEYMSKKIGKYAKYTPYKIDGKGYDGIFVVVKNEKVGEFESILTDHGTTHARLNQSKE